MLGPGKPDDLCAVTCFFNPVGYARLRANFDLFYARAAAAIDVFVVECCFGDQPFSLSHLPNHIPVRAEAVLWQKERLINHGLSLVPGRYAKVGWIDADVLFENPNWAADASAKLDDLAVVQLFRTIVRLPRDAVSDEPNFVRRESFGHRYAADPSCLDAGTYDGHGPTGFAWAARRDVLNASGGLYDVCVSGSADHLMVHAMCGDIDSPCVARLIGDDTALRRHFDAWSPRLASAAGGRVGAVDGTVLHLWHGEAANRRYLEKNRELMAMGFDPAVDIARDASGAWRWATSKPDLHRWSWECFLGRRDDG